MRTSRLFWTSLLLSVVPALSAGTLRGSPPEVPPVSSGKSRAAYANLPLSFELNQGQTDTRVRFLARGQGYTLFLTGEGAILALGKGGPSAVRGQLQGATGDGQPTTDVLRLAFVGANPGVAIAGAEELEGKSNYFIGQDPRNWHTDVPMYARIRYQGLYPGVDLVYYGRQGELEYDLVVGPGKDPGQARFRVEGTAKTRLNEAGDLVLETKGGEVVLRRPQAYQGTGADKRTVAVRYLKRGPNEWGFKVGTYRRGESLTIDPFLNYATYLGGSGGDVAYGIAVDGSGNAYVAGTTLSTNFPQANAFQNSSGGGGGDAFVSKLNSTGTKLVYSTYLGGNAQDTGFAVAIDAAGDAYVTGQTYSTDFPIYPPAKTTSTSPTPAFQTVYGGAGDAFVTELLSTGNKLVYSTYLGGSGTDWGYGIAVDSSNNAYVTGATQSGNFPTQSPFQANRGAGSTQNAFVTEVNPSGTALVYSTYLGGSQQDTGQAIRVDSSGNAYAAGYTFSPDFPTQNPIQGVYGGNGDAFVSEFNPGGSALVFSTYLGGNQQDRAWGLALDSSANVYVVGDTQSSDFPVTSGVFQDTYKGDEDAFVSKLSPSGATLVYSTYLGGSNVDSGKGIAVDSSGNATAVGSTQSSDFPNFDALQSILGIVGGSSCAAPPCADAFVTELNSSGTQALYSTFLGGNGSDFAQAVAIGTSTSACSPGPECAYVAGSTASTNFPAVAGSYQGNLGGVAGNGFVAMIETGDEASISVSPATVNFGNETVSVASAVQSVTVVNEGSSPLDITSVVPPNTDFTQTNTCVGTVQPRGGTCTINIIFTPTTTGPVTDQITINDNAFGNSSISQTITVTGDGVNSLQSVTVTPTTITFPNTYVTAISPAQTVTITNIGTAAITFTNANSSSPIAITTGSTDFIVGTGASNTCAALGYTLNVNQSCSVTVAFQPSTSGTRTGVLSFYDTATGSPQTVALTGNGLAQFTLYAVNPTVYPVIGATATSCPNPSSGQPTCFTIGATSAAAGFSGVITPACPSNLTCTFTPGNFLPGTNTSTLVVSNLTLSTPNPLNFTITASSGTQTATLNLTVAFQTFTLAVVGSPVQNITAGSSANFSFSATPENGFDQQVNFTCSGNGGTVLPLGVGCIFNPQTPTLNGSPTTIKLTITTTQSAPTTSWLWKWWHGRRPPPRPMLVLGALWLVLAMLLFFLGRRWPWLGASPSRRLIVSRGFIFGTLLAFLLLLAGCRGAVSNSGATPCGNYIIDVNGTLQSNSAASITTTVSIAVTSLNCPTTI